MSSSSTETLLTGAVSLLEGAIGYTLGCVSLVTPDDLSRRTPCRRWDLRALLLHLEDGLRTLHEAIAAGRVGLEPVGTSRAVAADPVGAVRDRARDVLTAWANARGPGAVAIVDLALSPALVAAAGALEVAVHGWDVGRACRERRSIPPALGEELLELSYLMVSEDDRPGRFAPPAPLPPRATPGERLVAFLGRDPR